MMLFEQGQVEAAQAQLKAAQAEDPQNLEILLALGQISISAGELETAESCLAAMTEEDRDGPQARRLAGLLDLARENDSSASPHSLQLLLDKDPSNSETRYKLAIASALAGDVQTGMDHLLKLVQTDPGFQDGAPREKLLSLFNVLGDDPLVGQYRRKLFASLH